MEEIVGTQNEMVVHGESRSREVTKGIVDIKREYVRVSCYSSSRHWTGPSEKNLVRTPQNKQNKQNK